MLHDSWSISAALARGFSDPLIERGKGPGGRGCFKEALSKLYNIVVRLVSSSLAI